MGRPLNKRWFGNDTGNQIACVAFVPGGAGDEPGYIIKQTATNEYRVANLLGEEGTCELVNKADGALLEGEMNIAGEDNTGSVLVTKLYNRTCRTDGTGPKIKWSFAAPSATNVQLVDVLGVVITAGTPADQDTSSGAATFTVTDNLVAGRTYTWELNPVSGPQGPGDWVAATGTIEGITYSGEATLSLTLAGAAADDDGNLYRVTITATDAIPATSREALLTFVD